VVPAREVSVHVRLALHSPTVLTSLVRMDVVETVSVITVNVCVPMDSEVTTAPRSFVLIFVLVVVLVITLMELVLVTVSSLKRLLLLVDGILDMVVTTVVNVCV